MAPVALLIGCATVRSEPPPPDSNHDAVSPPVALAPPVPPELVEAAVEASDPEPQPPDLTPYAWHADPSVQALPAHDNLLSRVGTSPGFARVSVEDGSFGAWLRMLPLAAPGTPVLSNSGSIVRSGSHANVAAVSTVDIGTADLQQCADSIIRMHAEWLWSIGKRDMSYRAASGVMLPYERWKRGERVFLVGQKLEWRVSAAGPSDTHASFRVYLDRVFEWANTGSLERQGVAVSVDQIEPGDFFVTPGGPGHAVLVLDVAKNAEGATEVLLGQGYMPAQSFHVIQQRPGTVWYRIDRELGGVQIPFWGSPFPWSSLRRLVHK